MRRFLKWTLLSLLILLVGAFALGYTPDTDPAAMKAKYANQTSQFVDLGGGLTVHLRDQGNRDGRAMILVHGSNASLHTWEPWVQRLGPFYRIVTLDLPGHGLTGVDPTGRYDASRQADVVELVRAKLGLEKVIIGGNSMGGGVSWRYALAHPDRALATILVDASGPPAATATKLPIGFRIARMPVINRLMEYVSPRSLFASTLDGSVSVKSMINDAMVDRYWELNRYPGNRKATLKRFQGFADVKPATPEEMKQFRAPVLILWGLEDKVISPASGDWFAKAIPGSKLITYPKVGHLPMEEAPDQTSADVKSWLSTIPDAAPVGSPAPPELKRAA